MGPIEFDLIVFREGEIFVPYCPRLDVSCCGGSSEEARTNLKTAMRLFLEEAERMGTLADILAEAGYDRDPSGRWNSPKMVTLESVELS